ncbi:zinc knuckle CX2CX4HX4C containing protein, partial [Tanacetum coccineum]
EGKRDGNNPGANPLNSILKKTNSTSIPTMDGVDVVNTGTKCMQGTLYGYFHGKNVAFSIVEMYILNSWMKYGVKRVFVTDLERVWEHGPWFIHNVPFILQKCTPSSKLTKKELTSVRMWIKFLGIYIIRWFECYRHSSWHPRYVRFVYYHHVYAILVRIDYARAFVDIKGDRALKDTMVISIPTIIRNGVMMHTIKGEMSNDGFQIVQRKVVRSPLVSEHEEGDNRKHMDELVADTRKKVKAPLRKTGIWSGRKAGSSLKSRLSSHNPFDLLTSKSLGNSAGENT